MYLNLGLLISFSSPVLEYPRTPYKVRKEMGGNLLCLAEKPSAGLSNTFCIRGPNIIFENWIFFFFLPSTHFQNTRASGAASSDRSASRPTSWFFMLVI